MNKDFSLFWLLFWLPVIGIAQNLESKLKEADIFYQNSDYNAAITAYHAIVEETNLTIPKVRLAELYEKIGDVTAATFWYQAVVTLPDAQPVWYLSYANVLYRNGQCQLANEWLEAYKASEEGQFEWFLNYNCNPIQAGVEVNELYQIINLPFNSENSEYYPIAYKDRLYFLKDNLFTTSNWHLFQQPTIFYANIHTVDAINHQYHYDRSPEAANPAAVKDLFQLHELKKTLQTHLGDAIDLATLKIMYPTFTADSNRLYIAMNMVGGFGGMDLYYMDKENGEWSPPWNMGSHINTDGDEVFPHWQASTQQLYFSSNGHDGFGGMDIYSVKKGGDDWEMVKNMGKPLNSNVDDFGVCTNKKGDFGFFTSNRNNNQYDIYSFKRLYQSISIDILDTQNHIPLEMVEVYNECLDFGVLSMDNGKATIDIPNNDCCTFTFNKTGYQKQEVEFCGTDILNGQITVELKKE